MQFIEFTDPDSGISYQYSEFTIANVAFIINFCSDADVISTLSALGKDITNYINTYSCCTIKFMAKEHLENSGSNIDIYAPAANHQFKRKEIIALQETLERLLFEHYVRFTPESYLFIAERDLLNRMYQHMCVPRCDFMQSFQVVYPLGVNQDCFILITPKGNLK
ncbi:Lhr family helicase [Mannheimia haemolytica]|uniref:Lhr family helicase n=1 Tax=Mannheimia haemolytica TaxID=75985 RepID=UPI000A4D4810|nr:Lhr family helicase [Mannheimia haemolytica]UFK41620.1 Lhr family helicase [Mannheimia haemolytica]UQX63779.1 Lhr family helicase [Mannheimia haemolytica]